MDDPNQLPSVEEGRAMLARSLNKEVADLTIQEIRLADDHRRVAQMEDFRH